MARVPDYRGKTKAARRVFGGDAAELVASELGVEVSVVEAWCRSFDEGGVARLRRDFPPRGQQPSFPRPSPAMASVREALEYAAPKRRTQTYGGYFSNALAVVMANGLRRRGFEGVLPDETGGFESRVRGARGLKKLDVNYSTPEMGLGLGLSIKTISSRDPGTKRYTKNYSRNDNELRAEAVDYHRRQPWSVLVAFLFLPVDAADDAEAAPRKGEDANISSFGAAVKYFRYRTPRKGPEDEADRFEGFFVCLYDKAGGTLYWPVHNLTRDPPRSRRPNLDEAYTFEEAIEDVDSLYTKRNDQPFNWAEDSKGPC